MSAIDALTNTSSNTLAALLSAQNTNKSNKNLDFNQVLAAAMQPALPGITDNGSSSTMMQMAMMQKMESIVSELSDTIALIKESQAAATTTSSTSGTNGSSQV